MLGLSRDELSAIDRQGESGTTDLVDGLREQVRLEQLIEGIKPPIPSDWLEAEQGRPLPSPRLLLTPFRYPPLQRGSRFARLHQLAAVGRFTVAFGSPHPTPANGLRGDDRRGDAMREHRIQAFEVPSARSGDLSAQFTREQFLWQGAGLGRERAAAAWTQPRQARSQISRHTEDLPLTLLRLGMQVAQKTLGLRQLLSPAPSHHHPRNRISV